VNKYFSKRQIADIRSKYATIEKKTDKLLLAYACFPLKNKQARHYAEQGVGRRIQILRRCIDKVFRTIPPRTIKVPSKTRLQDATINIQAFFANVYGIVDNLAWIWVYENGLSDAIPRGQVGLRKSNESVRNSLSVEMQAFLDTMEAWFEYLSEFRHALAHRIPIYIPPGMVSRENVDEYNFLTRQMSKALNEMNPYEYEHLAEKHNKLLIFQPMIAHSTIETKAPFIFHAQMIVDFLTVESLGEKLLEELKRADITLL
jgi:hypothetical protein